MKRISLLAIVALLIICPVGCATLSEAMKPGPEGEPPVAQTTLQAIGAAVSAFNLPVGVAIAAAAGAIGHANGKRVAKKSKPATTPAV